MSYNVNSKGYYGDFGGAYIPEMLYPNISELEKNEAIDKKLLRYLTVKVKKFDLETVYFGNKEEKEKKESVKN